MPFAHVKLNESYPLSFHRQWACPLLSSSKSWQSSLFTSDCKQPMSRRTQLLIPLICMAIVGSATFMWGLGSRLALRPIPLACFPYNCGIYGPPHCTKNILSGISPLPVCGHVYVYKNKKRLRFVTFAILHCWRLRQIGFFFFSSVNYRLLSVDCSIFNHRSLLGEKLWGGKKLKFCYAIKEAAKNEMVM